MDKGQDHSKVDKDPPFYSRKEKPCFGRWCVNKRLRLIDPQWEIWGQLDNPKSWKNLKNTRSLNLDICLGLVGSEAYPAFHLCYMNWSGGERQRPYALISRAGVFEWAFGSYRLLSSKVLRRNKRSLLSALDNLLIIFSIYWTWR